MLLSSNTIRYISPINFKSIQQYNEEFYHQLKNYKDHKLSVVKHFQYWKAV